MQEAVKVSKSELTEMVNSGKKIEDIMSKYNLNKPNARKVLKMAGLKLKKTHYPKFELVDDSNSSVNA